MRIDSSLLGGDSVAIAVVRLHHLLLGAHLIPIFSMAASGRTATRDRKHSACRQ
ncbi:hypothetical protein [Myxosarcina sp. GI1]|uniref:hypothetical protein n=1 Tax=Myxosarcina sp. GI1 TaxID=1541065 RepID=UPI0012E0BFE3|nr:hypothetical protein [Myxosarcina sp. GI1]